MRTRAKTAVATSVATKAVVWGVVAGVAGLTTPSTPAFAQTPSIEYMQPLPGYAITRISGIADDGTVVGWHDPNGGFQPGPVFRYTPGGTRTEHGVGFGPVISGDGRVISIGTSGALATPRLYYDDGTTRDLPNLTLAGQERQGFVTHLNHDGSVAMLAASYDRPGEGRKTSYRWTESGGTQIPPFPLGGSTWNQTNGLSSDGRVAVGDWSPSSFSFEMPWGWTNAGSTLDPLVDLDGNMITNGRMLSVTGDGLTQYGWYDTGSFNIHPFSITGGVISPLDLGVVMGIRPVPEGTSYDGSVLVGSLGGNNGSWIWTQETGAMRAADFFVAHGVNVNTEDSFFRMLVSADGKHFAALAESGASILVTIPASGPTTVLMLSWIGASLRRRRR
ncbi:MAG: hypothetical protein IPK69_10670 [Phycisphaerales bacterium]|nr:MAG: hypothetical protein IPK69_10670 [Phycisphaerales bacterium]